MATRNILVTGATGTTGNAVIRQLSAAGILSRALVRNPAKAVGVDLPHINVVTGDLSDPASLSEAMEGVEALYLNVVPGAAALNQIDNAIAAAKSAGVSNIVKLSGLLASADSPSEIIRMHAEADDRVAGSGINYTILRANSFHQNIEGQLETIKATGTFYLPLGDAQQSLIDVQDIAAAAIVAMTTDTHHNQRYDITGPESLSFHDVAKILSKVSGKPVSYVAISRAQFEESLRSYGTPDAAAASVGELFDVFASGIYAGVTHDIEKIIGRPARSFEVYASTLFT